MTAASESRRLLAPKVAIFDVDDTLFASTRAHAAYLETLTKRLSEDSGLDEPSVIRGFRRLFRERGLFNLAQAIDSHKELSERFPGEDLTKRFAKAIGDAQVAFDAAGDPGPGMRATLEALHGSGVRLVAFTEAGSADTVWKLKALGLDDLFEAVYAPHDQRDDVPRGDGIVAAACGDGSSADAGLWAKVREVPRFPKNNAEALIGIIHEVLPDIPVEEAKKQAVVVVGDNLIRDVKTAEDAGVPAIYTRQFKDRPFLDKLDDGLVVMRRAPLSATHVEHALSGMVQKWFYEPERQVGGIEGVLSHLDLDAVRSGTKPALDSAAETAGVSEAGTKGGKVKAGTGRLGLAVG